MTKRIVILGGGTRGTLCANRLHRHYRFHRADDQAVEIVVVDQEKVCQFIDRLRWRSAVKPE